MIEAFSSPFFQRVLLAALLASVACGVIGSYIVAKRITGLCGGLAHAAFGGVGLGYLLGFSPMLGAAGAGLLASAIIGTAYRRLGSDLDTVISMVWSVGMALGVIFVALAPGYTPDLASYLFGSLLLVPWEYVAIVAALDVGVVAIAWWLHKELQAVAFDEEFAEVTGVPVERMLLLLLALVALAIVTLIRVVGVILVIALLTIPAAVARQWCVDLRHMIWLSVALCAACTAGGLFLSLALYDALALAVPTGPLIVLLAALLFGASSLVRRPS